MHPSLITPEKGSTLQSSAFAGTTSIWPWTTRPGSELSVPSYRATTEHLLGALL